jgi:hypothetical protein
MDGAELQRKINQLTDMINRKKCGMIGYGGSI